MSHKYQRVGADGEKHTLRSYSSSSTLRDLDDLSEVRLVRTHDETARDRVRQSPFKSNWIWLFHLILLMSSMTLFSLSISIRASTLKHVRDFSAWSPAQKAVEYMNVQYNVTSKGNRFVGAGPEVDKAWREISYDMGDQWIAKSDLSKLDMPTSSLQVKHPQTGEAGYRVGMEVFHQLHCINLLRRVTYKEYYEPLGGEFGKGPEALQMHTDHCLEILRLNTQCNADIGLFTFYMIPDDPLAWPQLNSNHKCRNFDKVREWAVDHSVGNMEVIG